MRLYHPSVWGRCKDKFGQAWGINEPTVGSHKSNKDMEVDMRLGEKFKWKWSWCEVDAPKMYCFGEVMDNDKPSMVSSNGWATKLVICFFFFNAV